ncbi:MAG: chorismate-binding protein [Acidobacteriota bacterium]
MSRDFAFVQVSPGRLFVGWGPFEQLPFRRPERPAFFITDFFLDDPHPWRHPATWEELAVEELAARFEGIDPPHVDWAPLELAAWRPLFDSALAVMQRGDLKKIVPVLFENGQVDRGDHWGFFLRHLANLAPGTWAYGYSYQSHGLVGATPEVLFRSENRAYATMALAGTRPLARAMELFSDPKELREHRLVVDDIIRRLAPFGNVEVGSLDVLRLPAIAHLATPIRFQESGGSEKMSFSEMIRRLHPTAALGASPRNVVGERWLREADRGVKRRSFGAPFGVEREDRSALALVAIRNVQWNSGELRIGSGAGLLLESDLEREFEELRQKRQTVKALFGLAASVEAVPA